MQHDYVIANQGFPAFRSDLNDALAAIVSNNSGATEPTTMFAHQMWVDTAANPSVLKIRNADNDAWITIGTIDQTGDTFTLTSAVTTSNADINGGTIDGTAIGGDSAAAGAFTTLAASSTLTVTGAGSIEGLTVGRGAGAVASNTAVGNDALVANTTGARNTASGVNALLCNTTASDNVAMGFEALKENTTGNNNLAIGTFALLCNTTGICNTASGSAALALNTTGSCNTAYGRAALCSNTTASGNVAMGFEALCANTTGCENVATGFQALKANCTGIRNTATGFCALQANTTGCNNTASGKNALFCNTTGCFNTATGTSALFANTTGVANTASGANALCCNTTGGNNTASGLSALQFNTTGGFNTASGVNALLCNTTGGDNTASGVNALVFATTGSNNIGVGFNAGRTGGSPAGIVNITTESNRIVMGNDAHTCAQIKIAWTTPSDCRDKTCFKEVPHGLNFVRALKPTEYQFKAGGRDSVYTDGKRHYGFLAQDVLLLEGENPVIISADDPDKLQYTESHLIPVLVKAIQELTARVEALENA